MEYLAAALALAALALAYIAHRRAKRIEQQLDELLGELPAGYAARLRPLAFVAQDRAARWP